MKKLIFGMLCVILVAFCAVPAFAAENTVTPTTPLWVPEEEYLVLEGSAVYQGQNWERVLALREYADAGGKEPLPDALAQEYQLLRDLAARGEADEGADYGANWELLLIQNKLYGNRGWWVKEDAGQAYMRVLEQAQSVTPAQKDMLELWRLRLSMVPAKGLVAEWNIGAIDGALRTPGYTAEKLLDTPVLAAMPEDKKERFRAQIFVRVDGKHINLSTPIQSTTNGRAMQPVRFLTLFFGVDVAWDGTTQTITLRHAADVIRMALGKTTAYRNDVPFEMDVAPYERKA